MRRPRTVFVVGAGASDDFGFPVGKRLQEEIANLLRVNHSTEDNLHRVINFSLSSINERGLNYHLLHQHCDWMADTILLSPSIDTFLDKNAAIGDATSYLGKLAISHIIASREDSSMLAVEPDKKLNWAALSQTWIGKVWALMNEGGAERKVANPLENTAFVTFNYDRCIEQFLALAISQSYQIPYDDGVAIAANIPCEHVYGSLGTLRAGQRFSEFGSGAHPAHAGALAERIKTFTEQVDSITAENICRLLHEANRVVFLGFSFGGINLRFLDTTRSEKAHLKQVFGTAFDMSEEDKILAQDWADNCFRRGNAGSRLQNYKAAHFFERNYMLFQER